MTLTHHRSPGGPRVAGAVMAVLTPLLALQALNPPAGEATTPTGKVMPSSTQRMSDATLTSTQHGTYTKGQTLTLTCYKRGQSVKGYFSPYISGGYDNLWYKVSDGYYVADVDIDTGSNSPVTGACSSGLSAAVDAFVTKWKGKYADYDGAYGAQCVDLFNYYNRDVIHAGFASVSYAYQLYDTYDHGKYTRISSGSTPKKGDVAIWASNLPGSGGGGHVAIVLGTSGSSLSVLTQNPGATRTATLSKAYLRGYLRPNQ